MLLVLSTYVIEISYDIFLISSRHSPYGPLKNADFFTQKKDFSSSFWRDDKISVISRNF